MDLNCGISNITRCTQCQTELYKSCSSSGQAHPLLRVKDSSHLHMVLVGMLPTLRMPNWRAWRRRQADCLFIFEKSNGVDTSSGKCFCVVLSTGRASKHAHPHPSCVVFVTDDKMGSSIIELNKERGKKGILTPLSNQTVKVIDMRVPIHTLIKSTSLFSWTFASIYDFLSTVFFIFFLILFIFLNLFFYYF
jgi:hypothetical protein